MKSLSHIRLSATPWTVAYQAPPLMGFSRQEYWSGLPFPSPGDLPDPGIEPRSPALEADALTSEPPGKPIQEGVPKSILTVQVWWVVEWKPSGLPDGLLHLHWMWWQGLQVLLCVDCGKFWQVWWRVDDPLRALYGGGGLRFCVMVGLKAMALSV